jgi:predicted NUDIX family NTP pyrophosphohydrolase
LTRRRSAGVLPYRFGADGLEVLLVHPGGPFWQRKDDGAWSLAKGEFDDDEAADGAARREFAEETGITITAPLLALSPVRQAGGKTVHPFAVHMDLDAGAIRSNTFTMEWPPRSGALRTFPEVDRAAWYDVATASRKLLASQRPILLDLCERVARGEAC